MREGFTVATAAFIGFGVLAPAMAPAATVCVRDHNELQQALTAAAASPGDDEIKIREGIYTTFNGVFTYTAQNPGWLTLSGGWYTVDDNDCAQMRMDASRTILDGAGQHQVLRILHFPPKGTTAAASFNVVNLSVRNGYGNSATFQRGGGIDIESFSEAHTEVRLENVIVANNEGYFGGGANLYVTNGSVRIANSLFADNSAIATAIAHAAITLNATPEGVAHPVVVANSTFVRGRCAALGGRGCGLGAGLAGGVHMDIVNSLFADNEGSDLNAEGNGSVSADCSLVGAVSGTLPLTASNALSGDPHFVDPANGDFRLRDDSPFINLGLAPVPNTPLIVLDLGANPRSRFGATDPGAYENQTWDFIFADGFEP
jgi:hypothetical protein